MYIIWRLDNDIKELIERVINLSFEEGAVRDYN